MLEHPSHGNTTVSMYSMLTLHFLFCRSNISLLLVFWVDIPDILAPAPYLLLALLDCQFILSHNPLEK